MNHLILGLLVLVGCVADLAPDAHAPVNPEPTEPVAGYLSSDQETADKVAAIFAAHGIPELTVGSLGTTVHAPVSRANEVRAWIGDAIAHDHLRADIYN